MLYILLFGSRARGESHPDSGWDLFCHHPSRTVARRQERDHREDEHSLCPNGLPRRCHPPIPRKGEGPQGKDGGSLPVMCSKRGALRTRTPWPFGYGKRKLASKLQIFQGQEAHRTQDIPFLTIRCADMDTEFRHLTEWAPLS